MTVTVELSASPDDPDRTIVGFQPFDTRVVQLPFEVDIETGDIGGPSAGLSFTLALIDQLSPGQLTGGRNVAVTGTIGLDGSVGAIGGLAQKVSAVHQNGVDVFLVPASQPELSDPVQMQTLIDAGRGRGRDHPGGHARRGPGGAREARRRPARQSRLRDAVRRTRRRLTWPIARLIATICSDRGA